MKRYREIYRAEELPVTQNRMFDTRDDAINCVKGDVILVQDMKTGLIFNQAFRPGLIEYSSDYQNEQAFSVVFQKHIDEVTEIIRHYFSNNSLVEIGCGKGFFLEHLLSHGFNIKGIDPAYEGKNPAVIKATFEQISNISGEAIILRHVLEHILDPVAFLSGIKIANRGVGKMYIEVPCFDWICRNHAWFDVYYEHVNYFRLQDFYRMFDKVYESGYLFGRQYLFVVTDLSTLRCPEFTGRESAAIPIDFLEGVHTCANIIKESISSNGSLRRSVIWGGASKGVIFALFMQRAKANIDFVIDINPAKQGKYIGGSGLLIYSPEDVLKQLESGSNIFIMNKNYLPEIVSKAGKQFNYLTVNHEKI